MGEVVSHRIGDFNLTAATAFGPRIIGLRRGGGAETFAVLDDSVRIGGPQSFAFRGGHRLWVGPEVPEMTHVPDEHPCEVIGDANLTVVAPTDSAGFAKEIVVSADGDGLMVEHRLQWLGESAVDVAPWAITQLPLPGVAIMPIQGDDLVFQANRTLVLWPYTHLDDDRLSWVGDATVITTEPGPPLKIGSDSAPGRLGYLRDGQLFIKRFTVDREGSYPDRGAVGQVYCNESFCELESLGPIAHLDEGSETSHRERWEIHECPDVEQALAILGEER